MDSTCSSHQWYTPLSSCTPSSDPFNLTFLLHPPSGHLSNSDHIPASLGKRRTGKNIRRRSLSDCQRLLTVLWTGPLDKHLSVETGCFHQGLGPQERVETGHLIGPSGPWCSVPDRCPSATISSPHINQSRNFYFFGGVCVWGGCPVLFFQDTFALSCYLPPHLIAFLPPLSRWCMQQQLWVIFKGRAKM